MDFDAELAKAEAELAVARKRIAELHRMAPREAVKDYTLADRDGNPVQLTDLFGDKSDLIVVHNMGKSCRYCTLWADGFNGMYKHLADRAGFVVVSYDKPSVMREFAESRNWQFKMASNNDSEFAADMGFVSKKGQPQPGVSTFYREDDGTVTRVARSFFGPGDDFCALWHLFDMLMDGVKGWEPQYSYD